MTLSLRLLNTDNTWVRKQGQGVLFLLDPRAVWSSWHWSIDVLKVDMWLELYRIHSLFWIQVCVSHEHQLNCFSFLTLLNTLSLWWWCASQKRK